MTSDTKKPLEVGAPVSIKWNGEVKSNWVGYITRINHNLSLAEVAPETCIDSHLRTYELDRLVPATFTRYQHRRLQEELRRLRARKCDNDGRVISYV